eukprot:TRINITY_DN4398_c0_g1_i1.p1 TRINITY_DN4398_c0_g1~~TRINITY_DN4398_c0_g1_i1.p1  ORF type:complete len:121 (-),score=10.34 TRINITY_DN4398_c0_g1_i1:139-501(-)
MSSSFVPRRKSPIKRKPVQYYSKQERGDKEQNAPAPVRRKRKKAKKSLKEQNRGRGVVKTCKNRESKSRGQAQPKTKRKRAIKQKKLPNQLCSPLFDPQNWSGWYFANSTGKPLEKTILW